MKLTGLLKGAKRFFASGSEFETEDDMDRWINGGYNYLNLYPAGTSVYENINHVGDCVELLSSIYSDMPIKFLDKRDETKQTVIKNEQLAEFLEEPVYNLSKRRFVKHLFTQYFTYGNVYLLKEVETAYGAHYGFDKLHFLDPQFTYPRDKYGIIYTGQRRSYPIIQYHAYDGIKTFIAEADMVYQASASNPYNHNAGMSIIERNITEVDSLYFLNILQKSQFSKGALGSLFFESSNLRSKTEWLEFGKKFMRSYGGARNAGKPVILPEGFTAKRLQLTERDYKFLENKSMGKETIYKAFRIPEEIAGFQFKDSNTNGTAKDRREKINNFYSRTLPSLSKDVTALLTKIAQNFDKNIIVDFEYMHADLPVEDKVVLFKDLVLSGIMTRNEARERLPLGLDPINGIEGNLLYAPANQIPLANADNTDGNGES